MTRNEIIEQLFLGKNFNDCVSKMEPEHLRDDLKMEVMLIVCEWPEEKIRGLHERRELEFYVVRVILNLIQSNSSPFAKKYRKAFIPIEVSLNAAYGAESAEGMVREINFKYLSEEPFDEQQLRQEARELKEMVEDMALEEVDKLYWYNKGLIELYIRHGNYRAIEKETGIPFASVYKTIQKSLKEIKCRVTS